MWGREDISRVLLTQGTERIFFPPGTLCEQDPQKACMCIFLTHSWICKWV